MDYGIEIQDVLKVFLWNVQELIILMQVQHELCSEDSQVLDRLMYEDVHLKKKRKIINHKLRFYLP